MIQTDYQITNDITKADAWVSYYDEESCVKNSIIPNKIYKLIKLKDDIGQEEYFIQNENKFLSMDYICHKGDYVILKNKEN